VIRRTLPFAVLATAFLTLGVSIARAQDTTRDSVTPPGMRLDGSRLAPVRLTYAVTRDSAVVPSERVVDISHTAYSGRPAWLLVETHSAPGVGPDTTPGGSNGEAGKFADSLIVDSLTLQPLHWGGVNGYTSVGAEFRADSMFGVVSTPAGRRSIIAALPPGTLIGASMIEAAFRALPMASGWRDSAAVLANGIGTTRVFEAELEVVGQDQHLIVPAGTYDCWIVTLTTDVAQTTYWVAKQGGVVVKTSQLLPDNGGLLTYSLSRVGQ